MGNDALYRTVVKVCAWTGPAMTLLFLIGAVPLARFFAPPYSAQHSPAEVAQFYVDNLTGIRLGCVAMCFSAALFLPFGLAIAAVIRRTDPAGVLLSWIQVASVAVATIVIVFIPIFWGIGTYRAGSVSPEITQTWNDAGWFGVLFAVPPFSLWCVAIAVAIMRKSERSPLPRWIGYFNLWMAFLFMPAMLMIFFKQGPFAQNGVVTFWMPVAVFFGWIITMSWAAAHAANEPPQPVDNLDKRDDVAVPSTSSRKPNVHA
jgi:hypothetical protein